MNKDEAKDYLQDQLGTIILRHREHCGLSKRKLASLVGICVNTLTSIESGKRVPAIGTLYSICLHIDLPLDYLLNHRE